jgi:hypothetical protein
MFRFAAVGIAGLVALAGLLAVVGASSVPWVGGSATNDEAEGLDGSVPALAPAPALGLIEDGTATSRSEPDGGPSPISLVFPLVGELLNVGGDGGNIIRPRSNPQSFSDPQGDPSPGSNTSPNPSSTPPSDGPSSTTDPDPTTTTDPDPTTTTDPDPTTTTDPDPTTTTDPDPTTTTDPDPTTTEPPPEPTVDPGSLTTTLLDVIDATI